MDKNTITRRTMLATPLVAATASNAATWFDSTTGVQTELFDPQYYANMNADLLASNLLTYAQLRTHWENFGKREGRSPHPLIHPYSYLNRKENADLRAAFGPTNYKAAYDHYITHGQYENRNGTNPNLLTARLGEVSISASPRCAGAIDSLFFHGHETVNSFDHGRQIQSVLYDKEYDACFNPTQAGRKGDGRGYPASSKLLSSMSLNGGTGLRTKTHCAYWVGPNETISDPGVVKCTATNLTTVLSEFTVDTSYQLEQSGNVTLIKCQTEWVGNYNFPAGRAQVIPVTGYHISDFSLGLEIGPNFVASQRQIGDNKPGNQGQERAYPVIFSTSNGAHAIGAVCLPVKDAHVRYALYRWKYGLNQETNDSSSWAVVNRYQIDIPAGTPMRSNCILVIGQVTDVHLKIRDIMIANGMTPT